MNCCVRIAADTDIGDVLAPINMAAILRTRLLYLFSVDTCTVYISSSSDYLEFYRKSKGEGDYVCAYSYGIDLLQQKEPIMLPTLDMFF
jgi:hypothetical protein